MAEEAGEAACEQKHACIGWQDLLVSAATAAVIAAEAAEAACKQQHAWGGRIRWYRQQQKRRGRLVSSSMHGVAGFGGVGIGGGGGSAAAAAAAAAAATAEAGQAAERQAALFFLLV